MPNRELVSIGTDDARYRGLGGRNRQAKAPDYPRVAAMYAYSQIKGTSGLKDMKALLEDPDMKEYAIRAITDRKAFVEELSIEPFVEALRDASARVKAAAIIALGRIGDKAAIPHLMEIEVPDSFQAPEFGEEGPHARPNSEIILPHLAVRALVNLGADEEILEQVGSGNSDLALWALRYMHTPEAVAGLIARYNGAGTEEKELRNGILTVLAKLYTQRGALRWLLVVGYPSGHAWALL